MRILTDHKVDGSNSLWLQKRTRDRVGRGVEGMLHR